jgi:hypothetical protein
MLVGHDMIQTMRYGLLLLVLICALAGCAMERPAPVVKVGLLAPFEGERRELGYHLLPAIRAASAERAGRYAVEWVILDTGGVPDNAFQRTRELLLDPDVLAIVGPLLPGEVEAIQPLVEEAGVAWWPLAPAGAAGLEAWHGALGEGLEPSQAWGARAWPAIRRGDFSLYLDPQLPPDLEEAVPVPDVVIWPQDWLAWSATRRAFDAIGGVTAPDRAAVRARAAPLLFPPAARYESPDGRFPGIRLENTP